MAQIVMAPKPSGNLQMMANDGGLFLVKYGAFSRTYEIVQVVEQPGGGYRVDGIGWSCPDAMESFIEKVVCSVLIVK